MRYSHGVLSILAWWAIPVGAVVLAAAVSALARHVRRPSDDDTIHAYRRFREAISNEDPIAAGRRGGAARVGRAAASGPPTAGGG